MNLAEIIFICSPRGWILSKVFDSVMWNKPFLAYLYLLEMLDEVVGKDGGRSGKDNWESLIGEAGRLSKNMS